MAAPAVAPSFEGRPKKTVSESALMLRINRRLWPHHGLRVRKKARRFYIYDPDRDLVINEDVDLVALAVDVECLGDDELVVFADGNVTPVRDPVPSTRAPLGSGT